MTGIKIMTVKKIKENNKIVALIIPQKLSKEGTKFFTDKKNPFQIGILQNKKGRKVEAHIHNVFPRTIKGTQEMFYIMKGKVIANFFNKKGEKIKSAILSAGDTLLVLSAGHGFEFLKDSKVLVIKQGPYSNIAEDKTYFQNK